MPTVRNLLDRLAAFESSELPVLSIYLDMRPQATGQNPALRSGLVVLKDRLREIEKTLGPRGEDLESFRADADRIERYLDDEFPPSTQGLAIFACSGRGLFETVEVGVPFENHVGAEPRPQLFQLARLLDEQETAVVAVVDTNTARLFVMRLGSLKEVGGPDDDSIHYRKRSTGGWSEARYQRHVEKHRNQFADDAAEAIDDLVQRVGATRLILAGDEVAVPRLRERLSPRVAGLVHDDVLREDIRATAENLEPEVRSIMAEVEAEQACELADRLVNAVRAGGLGVAGLEPTRRALEYGQVETLLLAPDAELPDEQRDELVRLASQTSAEVQVVADHDGLNRLGGVGALLRYRVDMPTA